MPVCYVEVVELFTDWGLDNFRDGKIGEDWGSSRRFLDRFQKPSIHPLSSVEHGTLRGEQFADSFFRVVEHLA